MMWTRISGNSEDRPFNSANSPAIAKTLSRNSSSVAASVANPAISMLLATQTFASSSQSARTRIRVWLGLWDIGTANAHNEAAMKLYRSAGGVRPNPDDVLFDFEL